MLLQFTKEKDAWSFRDHVELADQHLPMAGRRPRYFFEAAGRMKRPNNAAAHRGRHGFPLRVTPCISTAARCASGYKAYHRPQR